MCCAYFSVTYVNVECALCTNYTGTQLITIVLYLMALHVANFWKITECVLLSFRRLCLKMQRLCLKTTLLQMAHWYSPPTTPGKKESVRLHSMPNHCFNILFRVENDY